MGIHMALRGFGLLIQSREDGLEFREAESPGKKDAAR